MLDQLKNTHLITPVNPLVTSWEGEGIRISLKISGLSFRRCTKTEL